MLAKILRFKTALMVAFGFSLFCPGVFAQGFQQGNHVGQTSTINRDFRQSDRGHGQNRGHGTRHYYHNGSWNRNGWFGWGVPAPIFSDGILVASLPPGYTTVVVSGNTYFYGENTYFKQMPAGGFAVVSLN